MFSYSVEFSFPIASYGNEICSNILSSVTFIAISFHCLVKLMCDNECLFD